MKYRLFFTCIAISAMAFSGCDKIKSFLPSKTKAAEAEKAAAPEPAAAPQVAAIPAAPTPTPEPPAPVINQNAGVIVFCYHRFEPKAAPLVSTPEDFEREMQALQDAGVSVIGMQDFLAWRRGEKDIPAKSAIITIDDGYISAYTTAWPILKKFGYPFTMFVYVNYIGVGGKSMSWDQLAEMRDAGVDIQSHTYSHPDLRGTTKKDATAIKNAGGYAAWLEKEVAESKNVLERQLAIRVNALAYPFGLHNKEVHEALKRAGYEAGFTVYGQRNGFHTPDNIIVGRYAIDSKTPNVFHAALQAINSGPTSVAPAVTQITASSLVTEPKEGDVVSNPKPLIKADLSSMGSVDANSLEMRISGYGLVPAQFDAASKTASFQISNPPLRDGNYTVIISAKVDGRKAEARWNFKFSSAPAGQ